MDNRIVELAEIFDREGWTTYVVGGASFALIRNEEPKDWDITVFFTTPAEFIKVVHQIDNTVDEFGWSNWGSLHFTFKGLHIDATLPRREARRGEDWIVHTDPNLSPFEDALRRHFTVASIYISPLGEEILDCFNGIMDWHNRILRATSAKIKEDPIRVLVGMQYCGRYGLVADDHTLKLCREMLADYDTLHKEQIWEEWGKWARLSKYPSYGLKFLRHTDWLMTYPALYDMIGCRQSPQHHPEGDVWQHTLITCNATPQDPILRFAALLHDIGKPDTSEIVDGKIQSHGHGKTSAELAVEFFGQIGAPISIQEQVVPLVRNHMYFSKGAKVSSKTVRRLARKIHPATINQYCNLVIADQEGRLTDSKKCDTIENVHTIAKELDLLDGFKEVHNNQPLKPFLGRHLITLGVKPGKEMGIILRVVNGLNLPEFTDEKEKVEWLRAHLKK